MDLRAVAEDIPGYLVYLTVDELTASSHRLAQEFPDLVRLEVVGETRQGDAIELLSIGEGDMHTYWYGAPDPDEVIGCMVIEYLSRRLCKDDCLREEMGYTWHFVKAIESDWLRLNEGWLKGPFAPAHYARHLQRPWIHDRAEWTVPIAYKDFVFDAALPETEAHLGIIDHTKPRFIYPLHNSKFGGVWYAISEPCPVLYPALQQLPAQFGTMLELGQTEMDKSHEVAPAIYCNPETFEEWYERTASAGDDPSEVRRYGISPSDYGARNCGCFSLVTEAGYWYTPHANDQTPVDQSYRNILIERLDAEDRVEGWIETQLGALLAHLQLESDTLNFLKAAVVGNPPRRQRQREATVNSPGLDRPATRAEVYANRVTRRFKLAAQAGMMARILEDEIAAGNQHPDMPRVLEEAEGLLHTWDESIGDDLITVPIRDLVAVQLCAGLVTAAHLRDQG